MDNFVLKKSDIIVGGKGRSKISQLLDDFLNSRGWGEKAFEISVVVDGVPHDTPTHKVDNVKGAVGVEVEWNNKTEFYDRDLNNFRLLHQLGVLSVGVIITRVSELQTLFNSLGEKIGKKVRSIHDALG